MSYEDIEKHLESLSIAPRSGGVYVPVKDEVWNEVGPQAGAYVPKVVRWFFTHYGGCEFPEDPFYYDPKYQTDVMIGWFLTAPEIRDGYEVTREYLPEDVVLICNDGGDNYLAVGVGSGNSGVVYFHIHDAPTDMNIYIVNNSFEQFLLSLHHES